MTKNKVETIIQNNKVTFKRYIDVPISLAFEVWTTHEHLSQWFGPDGFTITTKTLNFSNGGIWEFIMHGPDGTDYKNKVQFADIKNPHHIIYKHLGDGEGHADVDFESRIIFESVGQGTHVTMEQIFSSPEELERVNKKYGSIEGGKQHIANFAEYLDKIK